MHHSYVPAARRLYQGEGRRRSSVDPYQQVLVTVAGTGQPGFSGEGGPATQAQLQYPMAAAVGADGSLYIADAANARVRRLTLDGRLVTVAGTGVMGFSGDGGPATQAQLNAPVAVALGPDESLYIADRDNGRIRRVDPQGQMSTVAGNGQNRYGGDGGPATAASLNFPRGVTVGLDGSL